MCRLLSIDDALNWCFAGFCHKLKLSMWDESSNRCARPPSICINFEFGGGFSTTWLKCGKHLARCGGVAYVCVLRWGAMCFAAAFFECIESSRPKFDASRDKLNKAEDEAVCEHGKRKMIRDSGS